MTSSASYTIHCVVKRQHLFQENDIKLVQENDFKLVQGNDFKLVQEN